LLDGLAISPFEDTAMIYPDGEDRIMEPWWSAAWSAAVQSRSSTLERSSGRRVGPAPRVRVAA
jgi:hypothetical protein